MCREPRLHFTVSLGVWGRQSGGVPITDIHGQGRGGRGRESLRKHCKWSSSNLHEAWHTPVSDPILQLFPTLEKPSRSSRELDTLR